MQQKSTDLLAAATGHVATALLAHVYLPLLFRRPQPLVADVFRHLHSFLLGSNIHPTATERNFSLKSKWDTASLGLRSYEACRNP